MKFNTTKTKTKPAKVAKRVVENTVKVKAQGRKPTTKNKAGGDAYEMSEKNELVSLLINSFVADQFHAKASDDIARLRALVNKISNKEFVAKAGVFARNEFGMRSISHVLAAELAKNPDIKGKPWVKDYFNKTVRRVDDMLEIVSCFWQDGKKPLPNSLKKGFRSAFNRFDTYQLSKYTAKDSQFKLVDLVNLIHPNPTSRNSDGLNALVNGELKNKTTSQRVLTGIGQTASSESKKKELRVSYWISAIESRKIGYIDLLRNLTKVANEAPVAANSAAELLTDEKLIKNSKVMPFTLMIALKMVEREVTNQSAMRTLIVALDRAMTISCQNVPKFDGKTLVVVDRSGSMSSPAAGSTNGIMSMAEVGTLMGVFMAKSNNADMMIFGSTASYVPFNPVDSVGTIVKDLMRHNSYERDSIHVGHGTDFYSIFKTAKGEYDRILILSDLQGWAGGGYGRGLDGAYNAYCKTHDTKPFIYSYDLAGHGTLQFPEDKVFVCGGFSDKIFEIMNLFEKDRNALIKSIESVEL